MLYISHCMIKKIYENLKRVTIMIESDQIKYLEKRGINRSKFMRQAIESHRQNSFVYNYDKK